MKKIFYFLIFISCCGIQSFAAYNRSFDAIISSKSDEFAYSKIHFCDDELDDVSLSRRHVSFGEARLRCPDMEKPTEEMFLSTDGSIEVPLSSEKKQRVKFRKLLPVADRNVIRELVAQCNLGEQSLDGRRTKSLEEDIIILKDDLKNHRRLREKGIIKRDIDKFEEELRQRKAIREGWLLVEGWVVL